MDRAEESTSLRRTNRRGRAGRVEAGSRRGGTVPGPASVPHITPRGGTRPRDRGADDDLAPLLGRTPSLALDATVDVVFTNATRLGQSGCGQAQRRLSARTADRCYFPRAGDRPRRGSRRRNLRPAGDLSCTKWTSPGPRTGERPPTTVKLSGGLEMCDGG